MEEVAANKGKSKRKATVEESHKPVHTITAGTLLANIYLRQAHSGYAYYAYNLKRSYQSLTTKNQIHSNDFFAESRSDIIQVVTQASLWIATQMEKNRDSIRDAA